MSYTLNFVVTFENQPWLTLNAALYDAANPTPNQIGDLITDGFTDYGEGSYGFWATLPDDHIGAFAIWDADNPARRYVRTINPQEAEYNASKPLTSYQTMMATEDGLSDYGAARTGDLSDFIGSGGANLTAIGDTRLAHLDADVSSRLATAGYSAPPSAASIRSEIDSNSTKLDATVSSRASQSSVNALNNLSQSQAQSAASAALTTYGAATATNVSNTQTAITSAISALNNLSATDAAAAIMAYAMMDARQFQDVMMDVWAVLVGNSSANDATNPTSVSYQNVVTGGQVTHILDDTTRTLD